MIGTLINHRYRLDAYLGRGGMGQVFRARDLVLDRDVAVKVLSDSGLGTEGRARLLNEARAAARLNHPNIVSIYDAGETESTPYIVMELVAGTTLAETRPQTIDDVRAIGLQICAALAHAHASGIVHRDLKPENILLTTGGVVKLTDFGLARSVASRITTEGTIVGTVYYMAPEIILARPLDGRADLYALGVILYDLTVGRLPFDAQDAIAVISQHVHAPVVPPHTFRPDLPPAFEAVILKLLEKNPEDRYPTAEAVHQALEDAAVVLDQAPEPAEDVDDLLDQLGRGRLVGRRGEVDQLQRLWRAAQHGRAQLALISGEPGIGKTRLANELVVYARLGRAVVLRGGCFEYEAATPYLPFVDALREWVRLQNDAELREHLTGLGAELMKLAPEIDLRIGPLAPNPALAPNEERLRLFDHVARFFASLANQHGLLFFIDDIHWADQGTLAMLHYLLRHLREARMMVVACYRELELDRSHPFAAALVEWNRERLATRLTLGRLSQEDVGVLLVALFGVHTLSTEFVDAVFRETEGNPFFVEEVIKALIEQGQIYRENGRWQRRDLSELAIPQSIKEAIGRRLDRQSPACIEMLHNAAALGKHFTFSELAAVSALDENQLLDMLDEASNAQLVRPDPAAVVGDEAFVFTHDKIREVLYEELNPIRRRRLHLRIGENLEAIYTARAAAAGLDLADPRCCGLDRQGQRGVQALAYHYVEGASLERGLLFSRLAAEQACRVYALDEAIRYYQRAIECAEGLDRQDELAQLLEAYGMVHFTRGAFQPATQAFERALALASDPTVRAHLRMHLGSVCAQTGDELGRLHLEAALQDLGPDADPLMLARVYSLLGRFHHLHADYDQAEKLLLHAYELAEPSGDPGVLSDIYAYLAGVYQWKGDMVTSMEWARRSLEFGQRTGNLVSVALGLEFLAEASYNLTHWRDALEYARQEQEVAARIGSLSRGAWALSAFTNAYLGLGNLPQALHSANQCLQLVEQSGEERLGVLVRSTRARIYAATGEFESAWQDLNEVDARARASGLEQTITWSQQCRVSVLFAEQRWDDLLAYINSHPLTFRRRFRHEYVFTCITLNLREEVLWSLEDSNSLRHPGQQGEFAPYVFRLAGWVHHYLGNPDESERCFNLAVAGFEAKETLIELAWSHLGRAHLRRDTGQVQAAREDARRSAELFAECGAKPGQARAQALLKNLLTE